MPTANSKDEDYNHVTPEFRKFKQKKVNGE